MLELTTADTILLVLAAAIILASLATIVFAICAYRIAGLYAPRERDARRVPSLTESSAMTKGVTFDHDQPPIHGTNGYPNRHGDGTETLAAESLVHHVAGAAEGHLAGEREGWWEERRQEGLSDDEIASLEHARVVPVFEGE